MHTVTVKTDGTKTVKSKRNNDLFSFELHLIIDFFLTERKLALGPVKFPARLISHFAMNIIMAKLGSTAKVNSPNNIFSAICQNIFPPKFPAIRCIIMQTFTIYISHIVYTLVLYLESYGSNKGVNMETKSLTNYKL